MQRYQTQRDRDARYADALERVRELEPRTELQSRRAREDEQRAARYLLQEGETGESCSELGRLLMLADRSAFIADRMLADLEEAREELQTAERLRYQLPLWSLSGRLPHREQEL